MVGRGENVGAIKDTSEEASEADLKSSSMTVDLVGVEVSCSKSPDISKENSKVASCMDSSLSDPALGVNIVDTAPLDSLSKQASEV